MRLFIASEIETKVLCEIEKIQSILKKTDASVKWVKPSSMHFTYHFLGDTDAEKIPILKEVIGKCKNLSSFKIKFTEIKAFPHFKKPRVLWLSIEDETASMARIYALIKEGLLKYNFSVDKRDYVSHLTIGRVKGGKNLDILKEKISNLKVSLPEILIRKISLIESKLGAGGPLYKEIYSIELK